MFSKCSWLLFAVLLTTPSVASAQLRFTQPTANLGEIRGGPVYSQRFDFVNDSAQTLEITDIRLGCGCLQPLLDKRIYQAGEKGTLLLNVRTLGQQNGPRSWQAYVQYRQAEKTAETAVAVNAILRNEVTVEPSIIALTIDSTLKQEVTITDSRRPPLKVIRVLASSPAIQVAMQPMANGTTKVSLEVSRSALTAARQEEMLDIYTDDPNYRQLQVPITLLKANRPSVTATPDKLEIIGASSHLVRLRGAGDREVRIDKADADHPAVQCTWAAGPGNDMTLKIRVSNSALLPSSANVRVRFLQPEGTTITIPVTLRKE